MATLTPEQIAHCKQMLDDREKTLRADLQREVEEKEGFVDVATEIPDPGDSSFANLSVDLGNAAVTRDIFELRRIEAARQRIENGAYGECVDCEGEIPYGRLEVQPIAERCAPCQEIYEKTHVDALRGATM